ncbi:CRISPR system Cms endoribonuclease Csm3 [Candidatus Nitrotoga sp. BS]|uniref:type III-A CRISPR-associated RAMP protein Csm3 n=1 Tax=Candidatus Nitrotoga sp. BS TaxID=2890408 RepID=UPI001EF1EF71|nr:type III-A CRISPR-associated RAMP protein Csm3 [Candidatus Nitrotoga sp. BS]CAH1191505.1 CRISPR system Cms endoribonuclease Csm3 [Candidatus Nitrotoga sp. BS]
MKLTSIQKLTGILELVTGLHIGSGNTDMHIGGTDNPVIKHPRTLEPYIPGSSIKGKVRSLLEWEMGVVDITEGSPLGLNHIKSIESKRATIRTQAIDLLRLFGGAPDIKTDEALIKEVGPTRLAFWDCSLEKAWVEEMNSRNLLLTETKMENVIDRIEGVAKHPRNTERVPAGARFDFNLTIRQHDAEELMDVVWRGLTLLELTGLGGSGSRGYGKVKFTSLKMNGVDKLPELHKVNNPHADSKTVA